MRLYAQHGHGKTTKITDGLRSGVIQGAILSPKDESPADMAATIQAIRTQSPTADIFLDPQFHAFTVMPPKHGALPDYSHYQTGLNRRDFTPKKISGYVKDTLDMQTGIPLSVMVSPTVAFDDFNDPWSQIALSMAEAACDDHGARDSAPPLLVSLVISESAFAHPEAMGEYLDLLSGLEPAGFHLIIKRDVREYTQRFEPNNLAGILYFAYTLAHINEFRVIMGYTDLVSLLFGAIGVSGTGTGWHHSSRWFSMDKFSPSGFKSRPNERYTSAPLLNSIQRNPDLQSAHLAGVLAHIVSGSPQDKAVLSNPGGYVWSEEERILHHWFSVAKAIKSLGTATTMNDRLDAAERTLSKAKGLYTHLATQGVEFKGKANASHLEDWTTALREFRSIAGV